MKSGILLWNKGLFQQQARSITWIAVFFTLTLIIMLPLSILIDHLTRAASGQFTAPFSYSNYQINPVFQFSYAFQLIVYAIFPILLGIILVNFTTKKAATDFMHSLPFTRQTILTNTYLAGTAALLVPLLITGVLLAILLPFLNDQFYNFVDILGWMGLSFLIVLLLFIFTITIGMFVGNGLLHAGLTYLMIFVPAGLIVLVLFNLQYYVKGLALTNYAENIMTNGMFFVRLTMLLDDPFSLTEYAIYTLIAALFTAASYIAYTKRPSEATDQTIVFPFFRYLFLYVLTFFAMLVAGFFFSEIQQGNFAWTVVGYVLGAFIGYTILQMILQKTLRLVWPWKGFVVYGVFVALLIIPVNLAAGFYENTVPEANEVQSVSINNMYSDSEVRYMESVESIEQVIAIHETLTDEAVSNSYNTDFISIEYKLKDGGTLSREYRVPYELVADLTEELRRNEEYKLMNEPIFRMQQNNEISYLSLSLNNSAEETRITDIDQIGELMDAIEKDVRETPSRWQFSSGNDNYLGSIFFEGLDEDHQFPPGISLYMDYTNTIEWLKENNYTEGMLAPEELESVIVVPEWTGDWSMEYDEILYNNGDINQLPDPKYIATENEEIQEIYSAVTKGAGRDYTVIVPQNGSYTTLSFTAENAPDFIKDALPLP
ncbi:DUF6449 domain-containing protein [Jeotgalibacillus campisalis]|uniref:Multidrug ABC transporter permease n=1 Tax=Jeotgalibacillus campisalis TaxID=220754 RepID=A0A0C2RLB7_9BACL|nr:DUF6449 domain-containing protein [Jeotgalibacillus campisalis]KIL51020.1 hypothetical protein KR50_09010 [Jeotgalibacillus campisalis]